MKIKIVEAFAKKMKIKGLGIKTLEKLEIEEIEDIYNISSDSILGTMGEKIGTKLIQEIENSKNTTLDVFLSACSIYLIGQTVAKKLLPYISHPKDLTEEICVKAGLGEKATKSLCNWFDSSYVGGLEYLPLTFEVQKSSVEFEASYTVCITGKTPGYTKSSLAKELAKYNVKTTDSVSKNINYLICNDRKNSSKEKKAESLGIPILTLDYFKGEILNVTT